jgi:hypothetical protein
MLPDRPAVSLQVVDPGDCSYDRPRRTDLAVCFVFFNPARSKRLLMNYMYTVEKMRTALIPWYTIELCFGDSPPEIYDAIHVRSKSVLFHKERLCALLERKVSWWYTKVLFLDADIVFSQSGWYDDLSRLLDTHDAVQPFASAVWLDLTYTKANQERLSVLYMDKSKTYDPAYHPGFGWAFRRSWFRKTGFFQYGITGSGDTLSAAAWLGVEFPKGYLRPALAPAYEDFKKLPKPRISCLPGTIYHLWHGTHANRKYVERHKVLDGIRDIRTVVRANGDDVWELTDRKLESGLRDYFAGREDDGLSA